jgi:hypothetical protein
MGFRNGILTLNFRIQFPEPRKKRKEILYTIRRGIPNWELEEGRARENQGGSLTVDGGALDGRNKLIMHIIRMSRGLGRPSWARRQELLHLY